MRVRRLFLLQLSGLAVLALVVGVSGFAPLLLAQEPAPEASRALAQESNPPAPTAPPDETPPPAHPRVVLVLSGGGARGTAHIGVLKVLEEMHIPVDMVVGTSIGSIVGGLYAAGWSAERIEQLLLTTDMRQIFLDQVPREDKSFRRKQDDATFLIPTRLRFKGWVPYLPPAVLGGQRLELFLRSLEIESTGVTDFDDLPIPYRAVAVNLADGHAVVLDHGSLATAMRASMSIAGVFTPVELDGMKLVDGGAAANLPIGIAEDLGAQSIIAVDITSPLATEAELGSLFSIVGQMTGFLTVANRLEDIKRLRPGDVLISPQLGNLGFADFQHASEGIAAGETAAREMAEQLKRFSVSEEEYAKFQARHHTRPLSETVVDKVTLDNTSWVDDRVVLHRLPDLVGKPLEGSAYQKGIMGLYGLDYFGTIRTEFQRTPQEGELTLHTPVKPYGKNSLQFSIGFQNDFKGDSSYSFAIRHLLLAANRLGGEWENTLQFGTSNYAASQFYQPLSYSMRWFAAPKISARRTPVNIRDDEGQALAEYRVATLIGEIDFGRIFGEWGEIRLGPFWGSEEGDLHIGSPLFPNYTQRDGGVQVAFQVDTLDSSVFPLKGLSILATSYESLDELGADVDRTQSYFHGTGAWTFRRNTLAPLVEAGTTPEGTETLGTSFYLGGPGRLSGLFPQQLVGPKMVFARLLYYRELTSLTLGALSSAVYAGATLEAGNVYAQDDAVSVDSLRHGGSIFVGAKTPIGPLYIGYGFADGGDNLFYLVIGERF
jgi:NTE family protein